MSESSPLILSIVGTTAVGKTDLAFRIARQLLATTNVVGVDIISADSRQIYRGLEILSGADIPQGFVRKEPDFDTRYAYFEHDAIRLHGVSILAPSQEWSVSHFQECALSVISAAQKAHRAVIVVGGTGLYHDHILNSDLHLHVKPNAQVREKALHMNVAELQAWLAEVDAGRLARMNHSDRHNPRRLVRAIEVALSPVSIPTTKKLLQNCHEYVGLRTRLSDIEPKIAQRVSLRLQSGVIEEVAQALSQPLASQAHSTLGFSLIVSHLSGDLTLEQLQERWVNAEKKYAQRQNTWWRSHAAVKWFDVSEKTYALQAQEYALKLFLH